MDDYGILHETNGRYTLRFERFFNLNRKDVYHIITDSSHFTEWYPFATGEVDLRVGGKIAFDDGEGTTYHGIITALEEPSLFGFREVNDQIKISLKEEGQGCRMVFNHIFDDDSWAVNTAAGWHRCLDVLAQVIHGEPITWPDNATELREIYRKRLGANKKD